MVPMKLLFCSKQTAQRSEAAAVFSFGSPLSSSSQVPSLSGSVPSQSRCCGVVLSYVHGEVNKNTFFFSLGFWGFLIITVLLILSLLSRHLNPGRDLEEDVEEGGSSFFTSVFCVFKQLWSDSARRCWRSQSGFHGGFSHNVHRLCWPPEAQLLSDIHTNIQGNPTWSLLEGPY